MVAETVSYSVGMMVWLRAALLEFLMVVYLVELRVMMMVEMSVY